MCYINAVKVSLATFIRYKQQQKELAAMDPALFKQPARRGFDYSDWPVIKPSTDGKDWDVVAMEWGFLPIHLRAAADVKRFREGWVDANGKFNTPYTTLNAMGEELLLPNKTYRDAALNRRCLILSSGFYEHQHVEIMGKRGKPLKAPGKFPYYITVKDKPVFMMAGIYQPWTDRETGETKDTFAIITTAANELMRQVHNAKMRMPVILTDELADEWSNPYLSEKRITEIATFQYPAHLMHAHPVHKDFLSHEDPTLENPYPELPPLQVIGHGG